MASSRAKPTRRPSKKASARRASDEWIVLVTGCAGAGKTTWVAGAIAAERGDVVAWDATNGLGGARRWDFQGRGRDFLAAQASSPKRLRSVRVWGTKAEFAAVSFYMQRAGNAVFVVDEAHVFLPPTITAKHPFCDVLVQVRHLGTPLILVTWRPYNLPAYSRSSIARVVAFKHTQERDLDWLEGQPGAPEGLRARLVSLPTGPGSDKGPRCIDWRI